MTLNRQFQVTIDCEGAAFDDDLSVELYCILNGLTKRLGKAHGEPVGGYLFDTNGNRCGQFSMKRTRKAAHT